jgi:hypothetical protein
MKKKRIIFYCIILGFLICTPSTVANNVFTEKISKQKLKPSCNALHYDFNDGYILYAPDSSRTTYLINMQKEIMFSWNSDYTPGRSVYLLDNGNILKTAYIGIHQTFIAGGMGGAVQEIDVDGNIIWEFFYSDTNYLSHHDIEILPDGNVLMIAWEYKSKAEAISQGRNPDLIVFDQLWPDHIIEVMPTGPKSGEIVWEWHVWDHLIQDFDPTKANYGNVAEHPELIDINFFENPFTINPDWNHINSIDYNVEFDQILLSVNAFNEIWVIDHSTTTEEAASHTGGNNGKGGDILYRWGNPQTYDRGNDNDQVFYHQHDAQWIDYGCPGAGNILVFNNGDGRPGGSYSSIVEFVTPVDDNGSYTISTDAAYGPLNPIWVYSAGNPLDFFSKRTSGAQRLPNGNTLICHSSKGAFFEVTSDKETIWQYVNPYPNPNRNSVFKIRKYTANHPGIVVLFNKPERPDKPDGPMTGNVGDVYYYESVTADPQGDKVFYLFDWGDGTNSGWLGPYDSGIKVQANHSWTKQKSYQIKVKAKDVQGFISGWSEPFNVIIPRKKQRFSDSLKLMFNSIANLFPILKIFILIKKE